MDWQAVVLTFYMLGSSCFFLGTALALWRHFA